MRLKLILSLLVITPFYAISALPKNSLQKNPNFTEATAHYNYCNQLYNNLRTKGKFTDFQKLLKSAKKGLSVTNPNDFKNLAGLQFLAGMAHKIYFNPDSGLYYLSLSIGNAQRANELNIEITGIQQINYLYRYYGKVEETNRYVKRLNVLYKELKDIYLSDKVISALSDDFLHRGAYTQAVELLLGSLNTKEYLYKQKRDYNSRINLGLAFSELGSIYLQLNQNQNALSFLKKGEPYFFDYTGGRVRLYRKMQQTYLNLSKIDSATIYYNKIYGAMKINVYESSEDISGTNRLFAEYYLVKKDIPKAIKYAKIAYENAKISYGKESILLATNMMGNLRYQEQKYKEAIQYFEKALPNSSNFSKDVFASINLKLAQSYEQLRNYKKANLFYNKYNLLRDNINLEKTKEDLNIIEFKYKNAQKEQRISFLNVQSKIQEKELVRQKQYKTILIISVLLVLTIAILIFYNYKNKKKANLLLDKKNQQLDIINSQLNNANLTKAKLFSIISHDLRSPVSQLFTFLRIQQVNPNQISEEEKSNHQKKLMGSASNLLATMEDLLLWSKSQMEHFELDKEEIDINQLFNETIGLMQNQADAKKLEIVKGTINVGNLQSDQNLLSIVLRNLLQNAINNATNGTSILLNANFNAENKLCLSISNQGAIIPKEKIEELLNNRNVNSKSSGYGLLIVKEMLQKLNGSLYIESNEDATTVMIIFS